ncbi:MAG: hypothetical protein ACPGQL_11195 [Thermoplasmatota archaeon]
MVGRSLVAGLMIVLLAGMGLSVGSAQLDDGIPPCTEILPCTHWASQGSTGPANEIHVAVNPLDDDHFLVVGKDYGLGASSACRPSGAFSVASAFYVTFDGGDTWETGRVPAPYPNGGAEPSPLPYKCGSDPVALFGADGTAYYVLLNFQYEGGRQAAIAVARSPDGGLTWPASDIRILDTGAGMDKEWAAVGPDGRIHVVWTDVYSGQIRYSRSDGTPAMAFEAPRQLSFAGSGNPAVVVDTGPGDDVVVAWRSGGNLLFRTSDDAGATFDAARIALTVNPYDSSGPPRLPFMPQLAIDDDPASPYAGRIYLVWPGRATGGGSNVQMAASGDGGDTWTSPVDLSTAFRGSIAALPTVSVAPGGRVDVAWMDTRGSLVSIQGYRSYTTWVTSSGDGGGSWQDALPITDLPLVAAWSKHQDGSVFIGDYMGLASTADGIWPAYSANGGDRVAQGLDPDLFQRADAYLGEVPVSLPVTGLPPPAGDVPSLPAPPATPPTEPIPPVVSRQGGLELRLTTPTQG